MKTAKPPRASGRARIVELTDAQVLKAAQADPDCPPLTPDQLRRMQRVVPRGNGLYGPPPKSQRK